MRNASKVLFLVGAILSIVSAVVCLVTGIVLLVIPNSQSFIDAIYSDMSAEEAKLLQACLVASGVMTLIGIPFCAANSFFGFKAFREQKPSTVICVLNIVFGALSCLVNVVAGIFALVANGQEERREALKKE